MKRNELQKKIALMGLISTVMLTGLAGCSDDGNKVEDVPVSSEVVEQIETEEVEDTEVQQPEEETSEVVEESTEEVVPSTEVVEETEVSTEDLSIEEWIESLTFDKPTLLLVNESTGDKKILEEGGEYKVVEGDEVVFWFNKTEYKLTWYNRELFNDISIKGGNMAACIVVDRITEKTEISVEYKNKETDEKLSTTVYLSK